MMKDLYAKNTRIAKTAKFDFQTGFVCFVILAFFAL